MNTPFRNEFLEKSANIGIYELYVDGATGWAITFPGGYIEVDEGPHPDVSRMIAEVNGIEMYERGHSVPSIPDAYWTGNMSSRSLLKYFDSFVNKIKTAKPFTI